MSKREKREELEADRLEEVWNLHCKFLSTRAIAARLGLHQTQVQRAIEQVQSTLRRERTTEFFLDLANRLTAAAEQDLADSWRVSTQIEEMALARIASRDDQADADPDVLGELREQDLPTQPSAAAADYRSIASERVARTRLLESIARFNGLDPLKQQDLALKQRLVEAQVAEKNQEARVTELERKQTRLEARLARAAAGDTGEFDQYFEEREETDDEQPG